jgi:hypothetical protein
MPALIIHGSRDDPEPDNLRVTDSTPSGDRRPRRIGSLAGSPPTRQACSLFVNTSGPAQGLHRVGLAGVMLTKLPPAAREFPS